MSLLDQYSFEDLTNEAERLVVDELERRLAALRTDAEEEQVLDMAAYALNRVSPLYRVNLLGRLYTRNVPDEYRLEVQRAVTAAVRKVMGS